MNRDQQLAYWRRNLRYVVILLGIWFGVSCLAAVMLADPLDRIRIAGFPLGFWFGQQGSALVFVVLVFAYVGLMNSLDKKYGVYEQ